MTKLEFLNKFILQWFFIRVAYVFDKESGRFIGWRVLYWIAPTTGWGKDRYRYLGKRRYCWRNTDNTYLKFK